MRTRRHSDEVLYPDEQIVRVTRGDMEQWKSLALANARRRMRLCAHFAPTDAVHEMLIIHTPETYVRPHKHLAKSESFHVMEGQADVVLFDDDGRVAHVIAMGDYASGASFYYRLADPVYHGLVIRAPTFVFHESTNGPFDRSQTVFPSWAPADGDQRAIDAYLRQLNQAIANYRLQHP
jgi:cupin fold WbuC family metalloprotein